MINRLSSLINKLEEKIKNPSKGLPEEIFLLISRLSPLINVDLLIMNKKKEILLTWRSKGEKFDEGWHIPGGIIRFKDSIKNRLNYVAKKELNVQIKQNFRLVDIFEIKLKQKNRSHFISLLYLCHLKSSLDNKNKFFGKKPKIGEWKWFKKSPKKLIYPHKVYKDYINKKIKF